MYGSVGWTGWIELMPREQWEVYAEVLRRSSSLGIPFALGGNLASATHTGRWRKTNDMDIYVEPKDRERLMSVLDSLQLRDIQAEYPYDPQAIYRATNGDAIVELIWAMQNQRAVVDREWIERTEQVDLEGLTVRLTAPEEIVWAKLYVINRNRCDWPDLLNLIYYCGAGMDWKHLLGRLGADAPLLSGALALLSWLAPSQLREVPGWVLKELSVAVPAEDPGPEVLRWRASLLDRQEWFGSQDIAAAVPQNNKPKFRENRPC